MASSHAFADEPCGSFRYSRWQDGCRHEHTETDHNDDDPSSAASPDSRRRWHPEPSTPAAAQGWLDLGNDIEANEELEQIAPLNRAHPDVLQVRWRIYAKAQKWDACLDIATALTQTTPDRRFGWIHRAVSLDHLQRTIEAKEVLLGAVNQLGPSSTFAFHLACFCARLGQLPEANEWVQRAVELVEDKETLDRLRLKVLNEPVLEPIWKNLGA